MKILFWGSVSYNSGPDNVNKGYVKHLSENFYYPSCNKKMLPSWTELGYLIKSDVIVVSGLHKRGYVIELLAKIFGKKLVYLMHGYFKYEAIIGKKKKVSFGMLHERFLLRFSDLILPVSKKYMIMMQEMCPSYASKMNYLHNGIDLEKLRGIIPQNKQNGSVAVAGGTSRIKNNLTVSRVAEKMNGKISLTVYGTDPKTIPERNYLYTKFAERYSHDKFLNLLSKTQIYIVNSICESFNTSAIEALMCGCSVLISEVAGVTDLLTLEETDIIHDPMNVDEIKSKIEYLLEHPNNERILSSLDIEEYSYPRQVQKLEAICRELVQK